MIPRTKVNYRLADVLRALFVRERGADYRSVLRQQLREYLEVEHILLAPSGRGALYYILRALPQRRVLLPAYTCKAVAESARLAEKEPVYVSSERNGFNIDVESLVELVDADSIVIATHQFGIPCAISEVLRVCRSCGAYVIEDAAASLGTRVDGHLTGTFGDAAFFSFDSTKLINVPLKGGFLTVHDSEIFRRIEQIYRAEIRAMPMFHKLMLLTAAAVLVMLAHPVVYRLFHTLNFEWRGRFTADTQELDLTMNAFYTMDLANWQASLAVAQMRQIDRLIDARQRQYADYRHRLAGCTAFDLPPEDVGREWACIRFPIRIRGEKLPYYRTAARLGVDFAFSFTFLACPQACGHAARLARGVLDLPFYSRLTQDEADYVVEVLRAMELDVP